MLTSFSLVLFAASVIALLAASFAWRRRAVPGGLSLALTFLSVAVWCFFSGMETTSVDAFHRYLWSAMSYVGLVNVTPFLLVFAIQYSDARWPLTAWMLVLFWSVPAATLVLAFTNGFHHLIWTGITMGPFTGTNTVIYHHGPWYTVEMLWWLSLSVLASYHLLRVAIRGARLYMMQAVILMAAITIPWIGLLLFVLPGSPTAGLDTTSIGFAVSAVLIMTAVNRLHFLDLVPKARATLVENLPDGFLVLDTLDRIVDVNATAVRLLTVKAPALGKKVDEAIPALAGALPPTLTLSLQKGRTLEVSVTPLANRVGEQTGRILLVRDITERQKLITDLEDALASVKQLSGLLPICASCKKIRDDKGYWHQVESYMQDHTGVEFSHGLCPECMARLYPQALG